MMSRMTPFRYAPASHWRLSMIAAGLACALASGCATHSMANPDILDWVASETVPPRQTSKIQSTSNKQLAANPDAGNERLAANTLLPSFQGGPQPLVDQFAGDDADFSDYLAGEPGSLQSVSTVSLIPADAPDDTESETESEVVVASLQLQANPSPINARHNDFVTVAELLQMARNNHPALVTARQEIAIAQAATQTATLRENPRFVLDFDTPIHTDDPSEISTRLTFPIGGNRLQSLRLQTARAGVQEAVAAYRMRESEVIKQIQLVIATLIYGQQLANIDGQLERLAKERVDYLDPEQNTGDAASNFVRFVDAKLDAAKAVEVRFDSERIHAEAQIELSQLVSAESTDSLSIDDGLASSSVEIPPREQVIETVLARSAAIAQANAQMMQSRGEVQMASQKEWNAEAGPRHQDRLGEDDDSVGLRFASDLPQRSLRDNRIAIARAQLRRDIQQVSQVRSQVKLQADKTYRNLVLLDRQLSGWMQDPFVQQQESFLQEKDASELLTGAQITEIKQAILRRKRTLLTLSYQRTNQMIQLGLDPWR